MAEQQGMSTPMSLLITTLAGFIMLLIYVMVIPVIGGTVEATVGCNSGSGNSGANLCGGPTSGWNGTYNTALPKASDMYTNNMPIIAACIAFILLGLLFFFLRGMIL